MQEAILLERAPPTAINRFRSLVRRIYYTTTVRTAVSVTHTHKHRRALEILDSGKKNDDRVHAC